MIRNDNKWRCSPFLREVNVNIWYQPPSHFNLQTRTDLHKKGAWLGRRRFQSTSFVEGYSQVHVLTQYNFRKLKLLVAQKNYHSTSQMSRMSNSDDILDVLDIKPSNCLFVKKTLLPGTSFCGRRARIVYSLDILTVKR